MKASGLIKDAIKELGTFKTSKHIKMAASHLQKAIVQIGINERKNKILEDRKKAQASNE